MTVWPCAHHGVCGRGAYPAWCVHEAIVVRKVSKKIPYYGGCQTNMKRKESQLEQLRLFFEWILSLRGMNDQSIAVTDTCNVRQG